VTAWKVLSVIICLAGVVLIGYGDQMDAESAGSDTLLGDSLVIACAVAASFYMILFKKYLNSITFHGVIVWLGCIGLTCCVLLWPGILLVHYQQWEVFEFPQAISGGLLVAGVFIGLLFNFSLNYGIAQTQPLFMRLVTTCSIPASFVVDEALAGGYQPHWARIVGALLVIVGFLLFSLKSGSVSVETTPKDSVP